MLFTLEDIHVFMKENGLSNNGEIDLTKPIKSLGFLKINKIEQNFYKNKQEIIINQKNTLYGKGIFKIDIFIPLNFPKEKPERKIYHLIG